MSDEKRGTGKYRLGSAFIWAGAQGLSAGFAGSGLWMSLGAGFGGLVAGWTTAALLGRVARWGAGAKLMMALGVILGVLIASGAVAGLGVAINWFRMDRLDFDWRLLDKFVLSGAAIPAAILGLLTGLYVRSRIPRETKP